MRTIKAKDVVVGTRLASDDGTMRIVTHIMRAPVRFEDGKRGIDIEVDRRAPDERFNWSWVHPETELVLAEDPNASLYAVGDEQ